MDIDGAIQASLAHKQNSIYNIELTSPHTQPPPPATETVLDVAPADGKASAVAKSSGQGWRQPSQSAIVTAPVSRHEKAVYIASMIMALIQLCGFLALGGMLLLYFKFYGPDSDESSDGSGPFAIPGTQQRYYPDSDETINHSREPIDDRKGVAALWLLASSCIYAPLAMLLGLSISTLYIWKVWCFEALQDKVRVL